MDKATALEPAALRLSRPAALERGVHAASTCELDKATSLEHAALCLSRSAALERGVHAASTSELDKATALEHVALRLSRPAALERGVHAASTCELDKATALEPAALRLIFVLKPPVLWRKLRREMMLRVNDAISRSLCRRVQVILAALALLALCGCGSVTARVKGGSDPYCGFAYDLEKVATAGEWCDWSAEGRVGDVPVAGPRGVLWIIDAPLSFVGDTILLPLDLVRPAPADSAP